VTHDGLESHCLACGRPLPTLLLLTGSIRCHDCREDEAPVKVEHVGSMQSQEAA